MIGQNSNWSSLIGRLERSAIQKPQNLPCTLFAYIPSVKIYIKTKIDQIREFYLEDEEVLPKAPKIDPLRNVTNIRNATTVTNDVANVTEAMNVTIKGIKGWFHF